MEIAPKMPPIPISRPLDTLSDTSDTVMLWLAGNTATKRAEAGYDGECEAYGCKARGEANPREPTDARLADRALW